MFDEFSWAVGLFEGEGSICFTRNQAGHYFPRIAIAFTERLAAAGVSALVGTVGDAYDNAPAESVIGLYKTELIKPRGPWRPPGQVEIATLNYVHWYNHGGCSRPAATSHLQNSSKPTTVRTPASPRPANNKPSLRTRRDESDQGDQARAQLARLTLSRQSCP
jgi:hypothetical protein